MGTLALPGEGMPGVVLADGAIGLAERPGGRLFASTFCITGRFVFAAAVLEFEPASPPHETAARAAEAISRVFIDDFHIRLNIAVPAQMLRLWGSATAFEPARVGYQTVIGRCVRPP